jgi:hypothetical protein
MRSMFRGCSSLTTIYVSDLWQINQVTSYDGMFYECTSIVGQSGRKYNSSNTNKTYANYTTGYLTYKEYVAD